MGRIYEFLKSTILGGLFVLVPLGLLAGIAVKAIEVAHAAIEPVFRLLPFKSVSGVSPALMAAIILFLAACFLAGLLTRAAITRRLVENVEYLILSRIPGYALMKSVGEDLVEVEGKQGRTVVLVRLEASWQLGFLMDTLPDGRRVVFLPDVPNGMTGSLHLFSPDRIEQLQLPIATTLDILGRLGIGLSAKWPAAETRPA